jgi:hypothetical protein
MSTLMAAGLIAVPATAMGAAPASAAEREFRYAGAEVEFEVDKDDGRFEVDVQIDDAKPGSRWRVTLWHEGKRYHNRIHRADSDGEIEIEKVRRNTAGRDVFKIRVQKVGSTKAAMRTITLR